jgi:hypothetical protein
MHLSALRLNMNMNATPTERAPYHLIGHRLSKTPQGVALGQWPRPRKSLTLKKRKSVWVAVSSKLEDATSKPLRVTIERLSEDGSPDVPPPFPCRPVSGGLASQLPGAMLAHPHPKPCVPKAVPPIKGDTMGRCYRMDGNLPASGLLTNRTWPFLDRTHIHGW